MLALSAVLSTAPATADSYRIGNDDSSTSWYPNQPLLTPSSVAGGTFGQRFDQSLSGMIYAQPLVSNGVVLAVTENGYAYGRNATTGAPIWTDSFTPTATPTDQVSGNTTTACGDIGPSIGITGTPVIDPSTGVAYFVAARASGAGGATQYWMEAVDVASGSTPSFWPSGGVLIQGNANNDSGTSFNAPYETQRPGLVLVNGVVYAAFSAQCDFIPPTGTYAGWVIGVNATSGTVTTLWASETQGVDGGGIWQSGAAPVVDSQGDIYVITGNGWSNSSLPSPGPGSGTITYFGEAVVELSTSSGILTPVDWFIPQNAAALNSGDLDFGSGGPVALPSSMGSPEEPNVLLGVGKEGILYSMDMANLGGYQDGPNLGDNVPSETDVGGGVWGKPAVWPGDGGYIYVPVTGADGNQTTGSLKVLQRVVSASGAVGFDVVGSTGAGSMGYTTGSPIVTSNQSTSGSSLVWVIHTNDASGGGGQLQAYNPIPQNPGASGSLSEVWSSSTFSAEKYTEPGVGNAMIYVGTRDGQLLGFGFGSATPVLTGDNVDFPATVVSQSTPLTATFTATAATTVESFALSGSAFAMGSSTPATPVSLTTGQSITVPVTFTPSAYGTINGTLTANTSTVGSTAATTVINLSGVGAGASTVVASPLEADFSAQTIGGAMVSMPVTMTNTTANPISITGFVAPLATTPFSVTGAPGNQTLASDASVTFTVNFSPPGSSGNFAHVYGSVATLETSIGDFGVPLSGSANPPAQLAIVSSPLAFGTVKVGQSHDMNFTVENNGALPLTITGSTPPSANGFSATTSLSTATQIAANSSVQETVQFAPTSAGAVSSSWAITSDNGSQTLIITGTGIDVPGAPSNVQATAGNAVANVSWSAPSSDGASSITGYLVSATDITSSGRGGQTCSPGAGQTTCQVNNLTNGDQYTFSVTAINIVGDGPASTSSNALTPEPPAVLALSSSTIALGDVRVGTTQDMSFEVQNNGGLPLTITGSTPPNANGFTATTSLGTSTQIPAYSSLTETVQFHPTSAGAVTSSWAIMSSAGSQTLNVTGTGIDVPGAATNVTANPGNGLADVSWSAPSSDGASAITSYAATSTDLTASGRGGQTCSPGAGQTTCQVAGLTNGDSYTFSVVATNIVGNGPASSPSSAVTPTVPALLALSQPTLAFNDLQVGTTSDLSFNVENNGDTPLTITSSSGPTHADGFNAVSTLAANTVIPPHSSVQETVQFAPSAAGAVTSSWAITSASVSVTLSITGTGVVNDPGAPTDVVGVAGDGSAKVSWSAPESNGGGSLTGYVVVATDLSKATRGGMTCASPTGQTSCVVTGLATGDRYVFTVVASNEAGTGPSSSPSSPVTPTAPRLVITTRAGRARLGLTLSTTGDDLGGELSYVAVDGTARGCRISASTLRSLTGGTCVVVAYRAPSPSEPAVRSAPTTVVMSGAAVGVHPAQAAVSFLPASATVSGAGKATILAIARSMTSDSVVIITGFARGDPALARARGAAVSRFLAGLVKNPTQVHYVTTTTRNIATIWASRA